MSAFFSENPALLGTFLRRKLRIFTRRIPLARANFWGIDGVIETPFAEEFPLKVMKLGRRLRGWMGKNSNKKEPQQRIAAALLGAIIQKTLCAPYFRRDQFV